jgi:hypothetical protein
MRIATELRHLPDEDEVIQRLFRAGQDDGGYPAHDARDEVSTAAEVGVLIAIPGTLGYMAAGYGRPDLPPDAIGFVSLATFALTIPTSLLTTPPGRRRVGARAAAPDARNRIRDISASGVQPVFVRDPELAGAPGPLA